MTKPLPQAVLDRVLLMTTKYTDLDNMMDAIIEAGGDINQTHPYDWPDGKLSKVPLISIAAKAYLDNKNLAVLDLLRREPMINVRHFRMNPLAMVFLIAIDQSGFGDLATGLKERLQRMEELCDALHRFGYTLDDLVRNDVNVIGEMVNFQCDAWASNGQTISAISMRQWKILRQQLGHDAIAEMSNRIGAVIPKHPHCKDIKNSIPLSPITRIAYMLSLGNGIDAVSNCLMMATEMVRSGGTPDQESPASMSLTRVINGLRKNSELRDDIKLYDEALMDGVSRNASRSMSRGGQTSVSRRL